MQLQTSKEMQLQGVAAPAAELGCTAAAGGCRIQLRSAGIDATAEHYC